MSRFLGRMSLWFLAMAVAMAASALSSAPTRFIPVDYPGADETYLKGINLAGDIVGGWEDGITEHGFLLRTAQYYSFDYPGAVWTEAQGISQLGTIVGQYGRADGTTHGFLVDSRFIGLGMPLKFVPIEVPPNENTMPMKINVKGTVVGCFHSSNKEGTANLDTMHGFARNVNGAVTVYEKARTMHTGVNAYGDVVGLYFDPITGAAQQSYYICNGKTTWYQYAVTDLSTQAWDIGPTGTIVGCRQDAAGAFHGLIIEGKMMTSFDVPGALQTRAYGINEKGDIAGIYTDAAGDAHGFLLPAPGPTMGPTK